MQLLKKYVLHIFYKFIYVNIGCQGCVSDGGVFSHTSLYQAIDTNSAGLPDKAVLPGTQHQVPYVMVADEAFLLRSYIMKHLPSGT